MTGFTVTEFEVQALVDSQLSWEEEKQVRKELEANAALRAYYEQIVQQRKLLIAWWENEKKKKERDIFLHS